MVFARNAEKETKNLVIQVLLIRLESGFVEVVHRSARGAFGLHAKGLLFLHENFVMVVTMIVMA